MLGRAEIARLIPQAGSMVLLDAVEAWSDTDITCTTRSHRAADNPLRRAAALSAVCGVEYGGQAMALHGGLLADGPQQGMLAGLRGLKLAVDRLDDVDAPLTVTAAVKHREVSGFVYGFAVAAEGRALVSGQLTVLLR